MKTSNKFLLSLTFLILMTLIGNALVLKQEYDKLDLNDPFFGYQKESLSSFSGIDLNGTLVGNLKIIPGDSFNIYYGKGYKDRVNWHIAGDTLKMDFVDEWRHSRSQPSPDDFFDWRSRIFIVTPSLKFLNSRDIVSQLENFELKDLTIAINGKGSGILLRDNAIDRLNLTSHDSSVSLISQSNKVETALIDMTSNSKLTLELTQIDSLKIKYDSTTVLSMPGVLLKRLNPYP